MCTPFCVGKINYIDLSTRDYPSNFIYRTPRKSSAEQNGHLPCYLHITCIGTVVFRTSEKARVWRPNGRINGQRTDRTEATTRSQADAHGHEREHGRKVSTDTDGQVILSRTRGSQSDTQTNTAWRQGQTTQTQILTGSSKGQSTSTFGLGTFIFLYSPLALRLTALQEDPEGSASHLALTTFQQSGTTLFHFLDFFGSVLDFFGQPSTKNSKYSNLPGS